MPDRPLFDLAPEWRLATDDLQWIVQHYRPPKWRSVAFVATTKVVLRRVLGDLGVAYPPSALDHLPEQFTLPVREGKRR